MLSRLIARFNDWFSSDAGVIHMLAATGLLVIFEVVFPHLDPHGFWLLFWLTVYSAITQPALANTGRHSDERLERLEKHQMEQQDRMEAQMEAQLLWMARNHAALLVLQNATAGQSSRDPQDQDDREGRVSSSAALARSLDRDLRRGDGTAGEGLPAGDGSTCDGCCGCSHRG